MMPVPSSAVVDAERAAWAAKEKRYVEDISYYRRVLTQLMQEKNTQESTREAEAESASLVCIRNTFATRPCDSFMPTKVMKGDAEYGMPHYARPVDLDSYEAGAPTGMVERGKSILLRVYLRRRASPEEGELGQYCRSSALAGLRLVPRLLYVDGSGVPAKDYQGKNVGAEGMLLKGAVPKQLDAHGQVVWCLEVDLLSSAIPERHRWLGEGVLVIRVQPEEEGERAKWPLLCTDTGRFVVVANPAGLNRKRNR